VTADPKFAALTADVRAKQQVVAAHPLARVSDDLGVGCPFVLVRWVAFDGLGV
jgi:hypothetical protein